jgi:hypothetical protein
LKIARPLKAAFPAILLLAQSGLIIGSAPALSATFSDDFSGSTLKSPWRRTVPLSGPQISVNNGLTIQIPSGRSYDEWLTVNQAPRIEVLAPHGDFTISAELKSSSKPNGQPLTGNFHSALSIDLGSGDHIYWGAFTSTKQLLMQRDGVNTAGQAAISSLPIFLQVVKKGSEFQFAYKRALSEVWKKLTDASGNRVLVKTAKTVKSIGLMQKTWSNVPGSATWSAFSVESDEPLPGCVNAASGNGCAEPPPPNDTSSPPVSTSGPSETLVITGKRDPWLAGMPDGSKASFVAGEGGDIAPQNSPVEVRPPNKTERGGPHPGSLHCVPFAPLLPMLGEGIRCPRMALIFDKLRTEVPI